VGQEGAAPGEQSSQGGVMSVSQSHMNSAGPVPKLADGILDLISPATSPAKVHTNLMFDVLNLVL